MDKVRLKKICDSALEFSHPSLTISDFEVIPTFKYDDTKNNWVPDSFSLFVGVKRKGYFLDTPQGEVEKFLESLLGFECCVDFS
jgi:hypothetical protein